MDNYAREEMMHNNSAGGMQENKRYLSKIGLRYFIASILIMAAQIGLGTLVYLIDKNIYNRYGFLIMMVVMYALAYPIIFWMLGKMPVEVHFEKQKLGFGRFLMFFVIGYAGMYISNIMGNVMANIIGAVKGSPVQNGITDIVMNNNLWLNFVIIVLCAPIFEELLFRKYLIDRMARFGEKYAIFMSGLFFGLFHGNLYQFSYAFVLGIVFGYVYVKTGNIKYTISLHMIINFMGSVVGTLLLKYTGIDKLIKAANETPEELMKIMQENAAGLLIMMIYLMIILVLVILGVIFFALNVRKINFRPGKAVIKSGEYFKTTVCNVGMILFFALWIGFIIYSTLK